MKKYLKYFLISYFAVCVVFIITIIIKNLLDETPNITRYFDVAVLGANGNDKIDDTIFFQQALDKAKQELIDDSNYLVKVHVPQGTYYINKTLSIYSNTYLFMENDTKVIFSGKGNVLKSSYIDKKGNICAATDTSRLDGGLSEDCNIGGYRQYKNITIEGGVWDFNGNNTFLFIHGENLTIKNTTILNSSTHAINPSASKNVLIDNVVIKNQIEPKSSRIGSMNEVIHLDSAALPGEPKAFPIDETPIKNVIIENCIFDDVYSGIGSHVLYTKEEVMGENIIIRKNVFRNVKYIAINLFSHKDVSIYDNKATGVKGSYGFLHSYYTGAKVYNNIIEGFDAKLIVGSNESHLNPYELDIDDDMASSVVQMYFYVKYKPNGGKGKMSKTVVNYGTATKIAKNTFTKKGYNFVGWKAHRIYKDDYSCDCDGVVCWLTLKEKKAQNREFKYYNDEDLIVKILPKHRETVEFIAQWKKIKKVEVFKLPDKLDYFLSNTELDLKGGKLKLIYDDNTVDIVDMTEASVMPFDSNIMGEKEVTLLYSGVGAKMKINILPVQVNYVSIKSLPNKLNYLIGEKLDLTGLNLVAVNNDGSIVVTDKDYVVSKISLDTVGVKQVNIIYGGKSVSFDIQVSQLNKEIKYNDTNMKILNSSEFIINDIPPERKDIVLEIILLAIGMVLYVISMFILKKRR